MLNNHPQNLQILQILQMLEHFGLVVFVVILFSICPLLFLIFSRKYIKNQHNNIFKEVFKDIFKNVFKLLLTTLIVLGGFYTLLIEFKGMQSLDNYVSSLFDAKSSFLYFMCLISSFMLLYAVFFYQIFQTLFKIILKIIKISTANHIAAALLAIMTSFGLLQLAKTMQYIAPEIEYNFTIYRLFSVMPHIFINQVHANEFLFLVLLFALLAMICLFILQLVMLIVFAKSLKNLKI